MTQIMTSPIPLASVDRRTGGNVSGSSALKLTLGVILAMTTAVLLAATGNPFAFAIGAGIVVSVIGAAASWAAGLSR